MAQIQRLNLKWTVADVDRIAAMVAKGWTAETICSVLAGGRLESTPAEIVTLMDDMGIYVHSRVVRAAQ